MPLVFLPDTDALFAWGDEAAAGAIPGVNGGSLQRAPVVTPEGLREVEGRALPLVETAAALSVAPASSLETLPASVAIWALASKMAMELVARERVLPTVQRRAGRLEARWAAALSASEDTARIAALSESMPLSAHAAPVTPGKDGAKGTEVWAPDALLRAYLDAVVDAMVRASQGAPESPLPDKNGSAWERRFRAALAGPQRGFETQGFGERTVLDDLQRWSEPALGSRDRARACFRLELPERDGTPFRLVFLLQAPQDPSLMLPASELWSAAGTRPKNLGAAFREPEETLLEALGRASRLFPPLARALEASKPESLDLDPHGAWSFLGEGAVMLAEGGFGVIVPGELTSSGQRRLRLRMRIGGKSKTKVAGAVSGAAGLGADELMTVNWEAALGDTTLSLGELTELAKQKAPLVRFRGAWVALDPRELGDIQKRIAGGATRISALEAVEAALTGETQVGGLAVQVSATGDFAAVIEKLKNAAASDMTAPASLQATLRPYQERGLNWLWTLASLGLGACLADDMGLGKTIQLLSFLLRRADAAKTDERPALLVAPTSVVGNWEREAQRFAPSIQVMGHYGDGRARSAADFPAKRAALVITTYGLLRRDAALLGETEWSVVALDEAQNIKNAASATARAARSLKAAHRFALTGTPVENRLGELWSILEFANPGLLGSIESFRRKFAVPIERYGNEDAAARLRKIVGPFVLRRLKTDPAIAPDLPAKNEMKVICTLTREQATLYKAVVDEEMRKIAESEGIERRGRVLALLTFTKQVCNHPAQFLSESGPLAHRSGKLSRITEMLEEALAAGDKALVFTQFKGMGDRLVAHFTETLGAGVLFLHGGTPKTARDEMVRRFQDDAPGPRIFVLSLKAGGTGLNLTAANHVFHYDRWWNPAVEEQATDRAYRIGQKRAVQVHKLLCSGTVEEKIDRLLEQKRELAAKVVGAGERWLTELGTDELRDLFTLEGATVATDEDEAGAPAPRKKRASRGTAVSP